MLNDPFGFDLVETSEDENVALEPSQEVEMNTLDEEVNEIEAVEQQTKQQSSNIHPQIVVTEAKLKLQGPRQLILDTETTGFYFQDGDRIIEVGAIEMINRKLTGSSIHIYINPENQWVSQKTFTVSVMIS